ncbi:GNAT family N-acetyltransferase [Pseudonocardia acaciae]|uniref:GNAT family N-acetyltransferase n=1 Tax=Pseudonocardia acaciae TaxID=551276 RepID=UPI0004912B74|nr:GNAT family N-acetyltransferase [Pseudonocardia acaciae]
MSGDSTSEPPPHGGRIGTVHRSWAADLDPQTLYALLRLRVDVFVVEQRSAYAELDGRDLEPKTRHYWLGGPGNPEPVLGYVRLLKEPEGRYRIGRMCIAREARGRGLARRLMDAVLAEVGDGECVADAQRYLVEFYAGYGFVPDGEPFDWDGIEHLPIRRPKRELVP